jgi:sarcosine oxidase, subunit gamma
VVEILKAMTALGAHEARSLTWGAMTIFERVDVAVASIAGRRGRGEDLAQAAAKVALPLPAPARYVAGQPYSAFWVAPEMWFVEAPFASHEAIAGLMKEALGEAASLTEQTDAWVILDLAAVDLAAVLERVCNVDFRAVPVGYATRTVIEHLGCYLIKQGAGAARIYGPRSSAQSLLHALEVATEAVT